MRQLTHFSLTLLLIVTAIAGACSSSDDSGTDQIEQHDSSSSSGTDTAPGGDVTTTLDQQQTLADGTTPTADTTPAPDLSSSDPAPKQIATTTTTLIKEFRVTNPASGVKLYGRIHLPKAASASKRYPVVFLVPGGSGSGNTFEAKGFTERLVAAGLIAVHFDLDGRGMSDGSEDYCGTIHQDGLAAIIGYIKTQPEVDTARLGLYSASFGVTCSTGILARYGDALGIKFYVDWEGPANRDDTGGCAGVVIGHITHDCSDEAFWSQREASTFAKSIGVPYLRIQSEKDHVQPDNDHALLMVNNATATTYGGKGKAPWTRFNGTENTPNTVYNNGALPTWLPDLPSAKNDEQIVSYLTEMLTTFAP